MKILTQDDVLALLRKKQGTDSLRAFATSLGISAAYLSDVYNKNRQPGGKLLKVLGVRKERKITTSYFEVAKGTK